MIQERAGRLPALLLLRDRAMKKHYAKYITGLMLFGSNGIVATSIALASYNLVLLRTLIGGAVLVGILLASRQKLAFLANRADLAVLMASGASQTFAWVCLYEAYARIGVGLTTVLFYCGPIIVMLLSPLVFKERLTPLKLAGFAVVLVGVVLVNGEMSANADALEGVIFGLLSACGYAGGVICFKRSKKVHDLEAATIQLVSSFVAAALFVGVTQGFAMQINPADWPAIVILGVVNTGMGVYMYFTPVSKLPVQTVAVLGYLEPVAAVCLSAAFLGERLLPLQILGAMLIIGGAVFCEVSGNLKKRTA